MAAPGFEEHEQPVEDFDDEFRSLCSEMMDVMYQADGVGFASTQVGIDKRFLCTIPPETAPGKDFEVIVANPNIFEYSEQTETDEEGCLVAVRGVRGSSDAVVVDLGRIPG